MSRSNFLLTPEQKIDAREALRLLDGTGFTLHQAAKALMDRKRPARQASVETAVDEFIRSRLREECRSATVAWYQDRLAQLVEAFGEKKMEAVTRPMLDVWLAELATGASAKSANARAARALWRWALRQYPPLAVADPTLGLDCLTPPRSGAQPIILTIEQCAAIMEGAGDHRDALALALFAGVRPEELSGKAKPRLKWSAINPVDRLIRIPGEIAKVAGRPRVIEELPSTVWTWIEPAGAGLPISSVSARTFVQRAALLAGYQASGAADGNRGRWPQDALRHTFASYALALTADPGQVAMWLGHEGNPTLLHRTYRGVHTADGAVVTKPMAERFFTLRRLVAI